MAIPITQRRDIFALSTNPYLLALHQTYWGKSRLELETISQGNAKCHYFELPSHRGWEITAGRLIVPSEYDTTLARINAIRDSDPCGGILVTGNPGIGTLLFNEVISVLFLLRKSMLPRLCSYNVTRIIRGDHLL